MRDARHKTVLFEEGLSEKEYEIDRLYKRLDTKERIIEDIEDKLRHLRKEKDDVTIHLRIERNMLNEKIMHITKLEREKLNHIYVIL